MKRKSVVSCIPPKAMVKFVQQFLAVVNGLTGCSASPMLVSENIEFCIEFPSGFNRKPLEIDGEIIRCEGEFANHFVPLVCEKVGITRVVCSCSWFEYDPSALRKKLEPV